MPKLGLGSSIGKKSLTTPGVISTGRTTWAPFDDSGPIGENQLTGTNFTLGNNWTQNGTALSHTGTTGTNERVFDNALSPAVVAGNAYEVSYDITEYTSGSVRIDVGNVASSKGTVRSGVGSYREILVSAGSPATTVYINNFNAADGRQFVGTIDNVSVRLMNAYTGQALEFDGVSDYIRTSNNIEHEITTAWTISAWVKPDSTSGSFQWIVAGNNAQNFGLYIYQDDVVGVATDSVITTAISVQGTAAITGDWQYIVWTADLDNSRSSMYVNGALVASDTDCAGTYSETGKMYIGVRQGPQSYYAGKISNVQIWNKEWSASDVAYAYVNPEQLVLGSSGTPLTYSDLKLWYPMQDGHRGQPSYLMDGANTGLSAEKFNFDNFSSSVGAVKVGETVVFDNISSSGTQTQITGLDYVSGETYKVTYTISDYTAGNFRISVGTNIGIKRQANGTYTEYITYTSGATSTYFYAGALTATISNISIKAVNLKNHGVSTFTGDNLITNGTMEADSNWANSSSPSANVRSSDQAHSGTYSRKFTASSTYDGIKSDTFTTVTGKTYDVSFWVYPDDATAIQSKLRRGDNGGDISTVVTGGLTQDAWNNVTYSYTETAGGSGAYWTINSNTLTSGDWYVDDVSIKEQGTATGWADADAQPIIPQLAFQSYNQLGLFNGTNTTVPIADTTNDNDNIFNSGGSISAWVWAEGVGDGSYGRIVDKSASTSAASGFTFFVREESGSTCKLAFQKGHSTTDGQWKTTSEDLIYNQWNHVAVVYNASSTSNNASLYINGVESAVTEGATPVGTSEDDDAQVLTIGNRSGTNDRQFEGYITEVSLWTEELTLAKIQELYNDGEALDATLHSSVANLSGYWRNEGKSTWTDLSTNGNNGTPANVTETLILPEGKNSRDIQGFLMNRFRTSGINIPNTSNDVSGYIDAGALTLAASDSFTLSWWAKPYSLSDNYMFGTAGADYISIISASNIRFNPSNASHATLVPDSAIVENQWIHITITRIADGKTNLFINGVDQDTEQTLNEPFNFRYIGGISLFNFDGVIDDVALYDGTALSAAQILRNYKAGKRRHQN